MTGKDDKGFETLEVIDKTLYKEDGAPVLLSDEDKPYRKAYRALAKRLQQMPPDGKYGFDGKKMWLVSYKPNVRMVGLIH